MPRRIIIISDKNFASIGPKLKASLESVGFEVFYLDAKVKGNPLVSQAFNGDHKDMFVIYYDPGNVYGRHAVFTQNINAPPDISWGLYHGSSIYRVTNIIMETNARICSAVIKKNNRTYKVYRKAGNRNGINVHSNHMRDSNKFFDSLTPVVMCGTEDLLDMNEKSVFLGQPQDPWPDFKEGKIPNKIGHITTPWGNADVKKGTKHIKQAFDCIDFMQSEIIGYAKVAHWRCMNFMDSCGMMVSTMTDWDYGLGYTGLEALSMSCLAMSKNSKMARNIGSKIVHVRDSNQLVSMAKYYHDNIDEFHAKRREQYDWGKAHFTNQAVGQRFKAILQNAIDHSWRGVDKNFRRM